MEIKNILDFDIGQSFDGKTIFITGSGGLIGSALVKYFQELQKHYQIRLVLTSKNGNFNFEPTPNSEILVGDLCRISFLSQLPSADFIFHTAGYGQPDKFQALPFETIQLNSFVLLNLLDKLNNNGKFLYCSSSEVYAGLISPPFSENQIGNTGPLHPRAAYIESKKIGETIVSNFNSKNQGKFAVAARISLVYGPGYKNGDTRVLNSIIDSALKNNFIRLRDSGTATRTYCYISDTIEMMIGLILNGADSIYNLGGIEQTTIRNLAELVSEIADVPLYIPNLVGQFKSDAPQDVQLDMTKTLKLCNKINFVKLKEGLINTIKWREQNLIDEK